MKRTIKQWCVARQIGWLGQGRIGSLRYDWKIILGKGRTAVFSGSVEGTRPNVKSIGKRSILVFPNVNQPKANGKISEPAFLSILAWVQDCLDGNVRELKSPGNSTAPSHTATPGTPSEPPHD